MAIERTTIQGTLYGPGGSPVPGGKITAELSNPGSAPDTTSGDDEAVAGTQEFTIGGNGALSFTLVPNDVITPAGTIYKITFELPDRYTWTEFWSVSTTPDPLEIGDVTKVIGPSVAALIPDIPGVTVLPTAGPIYHRKVLVLLGVSGVSDDVAVICLATMVAGNFEWSALAAGGEV